ncbi:MAG TPA: ABC transporter permease [Anaerolineaceae bacterium]|nr:ABC transporter permease [Anaerolineaceae bacterium]
MIKALVRRIRLYIAQAWLSYHGRFSITHPFGYITSKLGFPFFLMIFFIFMGKFVGFSDPLYIVIGNLLLIPANNGMAGITLAIGDERGWGTLSYVLGSPAPRAPVFIGRAIFYIVDGFFTALLGFVIAAGIFHMDLSGVGLWLLVLCTFLLAVTASGIGFLFGSISLISRDGWTVLTTFIQALYILVGVNFPVDALPGVLQKVAYGLPLTRGVMAARLVLDGAGWSAIRSLVVGETLIGALYSAAGYVIFRIIEKRSTISGTLDAL